MSDPREYKLTPEQERVKAQLIADCEAALESFVGPQDPSTVLDRARESMEQIVGQPCIARFGEDEGVIEISTPVVRLDERESHDGP